VGWIAQLVPFQRAANVTWTPRLLWADPTAVHAVVELQEVPENLPCGAV
jgi:hypothetical protein